MEMCFYNEISRTVLIKISMKVDLDGNQRVVTTEEGKALANKVQSIPGMYKLPIKFVGEEYKKGKPEE